MSYSSLPPLLMLTLIKESPDQLPPPPEISSIGISVTDIQDELRKIIIGLLIERQDAGPIQVRVTSNKPKRHKDVDKALKEFITE